MGELKNLNSLRDERMKPVSSHPDVDDEIANDGLHPSEAAVDSLAHDEKQSSRKKPIMSINGRDVDDHRERAA